MVIVDYIFINSLALPHSIFTDTAKMHCTVIIIIELPGLLPFQACFGPNLAVFFVFFVPTHISEMYHVEMV